MKAYYGSAISENIVQTPEGFLICKNAPIARTGSQDYLRSELGIEGGNPNDIISVLRTESEVFSPATIASMEGKPVTFDHPPEGVDVQNIAAYGCGHIQNVHRGVGGESDLLIGDLFVTNSRLIEAIQNGLREISCGYDAEYALGADGNIYQRCIRGNHVAVVPAGRAGHRVAIKDSAESTTTNDEERGTKTMSKRNMPTLLARLFSHAVKDMEPGEVADTIDEIAAAASTDEDPAQAQPATTDSGNACGAGDGDPIQALTAAVNALLQKLNAAPSIDIDEDPAQAQTPAPNEAKESADPLEKLADEIMSAATEAPADQEAAATIPADELPEATADEGEEPTTDEDGPDSPASTLPENPIPGADRAAIRYAYAALSAVKPVIATLPPKERKAAADRAATEIRKMLGKPAKSANNGYVGITNTMRQAAKTRAKDSRPKADNGELGRKIMESRNPHYAKKS